MKGISSLIFDLFFSLSSFLSNSNKKNPCSSSVLYTKGDVDVKYNNFHE